MNVHLISPLFPDFLETAGLFDRIGNNNVNDLLNTLATSVMQFHGEHVDSAFAPLRANCTATLIPDAFVIRDMFHEADCGDVTLEDTKVLIVELTPPVENGQSDLANLFTVQECRISVGEDCDLDRP